MKIINYTIIIPHKNIPDLLQRCLDSIPRRDDMQIIVVDDNSDADKVDFDNFPGLNDPYVEVIFGKNENGRKGAGYARNLGLERAKGKWLIFADADDFFNPCLEEALDKYRENKDDIVFFKATSIFSDTYEKCFRDEYVNYPLSEIQQTGNWDSALRIFSPCDKFIKRDYIQKNEIFFQEVLYSNDVFFSVKSTLLSNKKLIDDLQIYCITYRDDSLTQKNTIDTIKIRFEVVCGTAKFLKDYRKQKYLIEDVYGRWVWIYKEDKIIGAKLLLQIFPIYGFIIFKYIKWRDIYNIKQTFLWKQVRKMKQNLLK